MKKQRKSLTKAAGLKSVLFYSKEVVLTSFKKGSEADIEKRIKGANIVYEKEPKVFDANVQGTSVIIKSTNGISAATDHPFPVEISKRKMKKQRALKRAKDEGLIFVDKKPGDDMLRAKSEIEKMFFGSTFDDNVKVQIAYNILDIKKIIAPYINDIIYSMNNMLRQDSIESSDLIGSMRWDRSYQDFIGQDEQSYHYKNVELFKTFVETSKPYMHYYGNVFIKEIKEENALDDSGNIKINPKTQKPIKLKKIVYQSDEDIHKILRVLSLVRQSTIHDQNSTREILYNESDWPDDLKEFITQIYQKKIHQVNTEFISSNRRANFQILFDIYNLEPKSKQAKDMCRLFYRYVVMAEGKNLGFSIKKLRESMLKQPKAQSILSHDYDTIRGKLYTFMDFMIFQDMLERERDHKDISKIVERLRMQLTEEDKDLLYEQEGKLAWDRYGSTISNRLLPLMSGDKIKALNKKKAAVYESDFSDVMAGTEVNNFSKMLYFICLFLDGKEINDMLSNIINKLDNIESLIAVDKSLRGGTSIDQQIALLQQHFGNHTTTIDLKDDASGSLLPKYRMFDQASSVADEIRLVKSIVRMDREIHQNAKIFIDAANLLGISVQLKKGYDQNGKELIDDQVEEEYVKNKIFGNLMDTNLKNFISNNVVESRRFQYLARHVNTKNARKIAENKEVVTFVLKRIPIAQIERYYQSIVPKSESINLDAKIDYLTQQIAGMSFEKLFDVVQKVKQHSRESIEKERKKALVGLYLTVIYLIYKNLVNINARYAIAFHCLERDLGFYGLSINSSKRKGYTDLTYKFLDYGYLNKRQREILKHNLVQLENENPIHDYRNQIAHLNAVREAHLLIEKVSRIHSYFSLYHGINQLYMYNKEHKSYGDFVSAALERVSVNRTYSKDLLHVLHTPFGYNTARYKNLSIDDLFDKNEKREDKPISKHE